MKYALILPDGAADEPVKELDGQTPLQAARTPNMDWISSNGRIGTVRTVPEGFLPASDVATLSVIGYDPHRYYTGRAPLEAAAQHLAVGSDDLVFRCNLTTIIDGMMVDFSAGHIAQAEAEALIEALNHGLADERIRFHAGVMYRHLMLLKKASKFDCSCTPPHDIPGQPIAKHLPRGKDAELIRDLMLRSGEILENHQVNQIRRDLGESPATSIWLWGQGNMPDLPDFESRFGVRGACITAVDLIRGIATLVGWALLQVEGATGYLDTNYKGKGEQAVAALDKYDLITVHIEAPDEAGHSGDAQAKVQAIERIDEHVVGPVLEKLKDFPKWRVLLLPDHPTPVAKRTHTAVPPPFCMAGSDVPHVRGASFSEISAENGDLHIETGHDLMEYFLQS